MASNTDISVAKGGSAVLSAMSLRITDLAPLQVQSIDVPIGMEMIDASLNWAAVDVEMNALDPQQRLHLLAADLDSDLGRRQNRSDELAGSADRELAVERG